MTGEEVERVVDVWIDIVEEWVVDGVLLLSVVDSSLVDVSKYSSGPGVIIKDIFSCYIYIDSTVLCFCVVIPTYA